MLTENQAPIAIANHLASRSRPRKIKEIIEEMGIPDSVHRTTVLRWMYKAQEMNLIEMSGSKRGSLWNASDRLQRESLISKINLPIEKRPRVTYEESFLEDYVPNKSYYLSTKNREKLHKQCETGSAEFSQLPLHDQSLFLCGLSYASSHMEGNAYDFIATEKLLMEGLEKDGAKPEETTMVRNHHEAIRFLVDNIRHPPLKNDVNMTMRDVKSIHALLSNFLLKDPMMCGAVRHSPVRIKHSSYIPMTVHESLERALALICEKAGKIDDPYEQSFFLLAHLPYLQPFEDCNKRTSRVACNIPLLRKGVIPMSWMDVDQTSYNTALIGIYERTNTSLLAEVFVEGYMRSSERFEIMKKSAIPDETQMRYRNEIRAMIRSIVLDGDTDIPNEVMDADKEAFIGHVEKELALLKTENMGAIVRYRFSDGDVRDWIESSQASSYRCVEIG